MPLSNQLTGTAGEYFVAAELSRRGYIASISLRNAKGVDILVTSEDSNETLNIQVKTAKNKKAIWILSKKNETIISDRFFYILVLLPPDDMQRPHFYIVPSKRVARYISVFHKRHLAAGNQGSDMRKFRDRFNRYLEKWDQVSIK